MKILVPLLAVLALFTVATLGAYAGLHWVFGIGVPYLAAVIFLVGFAYRVMSWARVPVPFRIPTTCGQQQSLPWIKQNKVDNPSTGWGAIGRVALEVLLFRSLLRNTKADLVGGERLVYGSDLALWLGAMAMHWSLLLILVRHLRLLSQPVPGFVTALENVDGFLEIGLPVVFVTSAVFLAGLTYLLLRRLLNRRIRYIPLPADYFPLFLLLGIGASGFVLRHLVRTDLVGVKQLALGLTHFSPVVPDSVGPLFYGHLFLVCVLLAYFPFSKLVHLAGVVLSPTRNLANNNRRERHVNPWDYPVTVHTYEEYETEFGEKMKAAGLPVERS